MDTVHTELAPEGQGLAMPSQRGQAGPTSELTERGHELAGEGLELVVGQRDEVDLVGDIPQDLVDANGEGNQFALGQICSQRAETEQSQPWLLGDSPHTVRPLTPPLLPTSFLSCPSPLCQAQNSALPLPRALITMGHSPLSLAPRTVGLEPSTKPSCQES